MDERTDDEWMDGLDGWTNRLWINGWMDDDDDDYDDDEEE
jgi:hypothetical protein